LTGSGKANSLISFFAASMLAAFEIEKTSVFGNFLDLINRFKSFVVSSSSSIYSKD
jgi:hypothetical protein